MIKPLVLFDAWNIQILSVFNCTGVVFQMKHRECWDMVFCTILVCKSGKKCYVNFSSHCVNACLISSIERSLMNVGQIFKSNMI